MGAQFLSESITDGRKGKEMRLFIYDWDFITKYDLYCTMQAQGIACDLFRTPARPRIEKEKEQFLEDVQKALKEKPYDAVFSVNYVSELAEAAHDKGILYICWTYDSPALSGTGLWFDTNRIFCFDPAEYREWKDRGLPHLYYLPLAVDTGRLSRMKPTPMEQMKYRADVSFVGQLYQADMDQTFPLFDEYSAGYVAALINTHLRLPGKNMLSELINEPVRERLCNPQVEEALIRNMETTAYMPDVKELTTGSLIGFLNKAITNKERVLLLQLLAKYCKVKLFTRWKPELPGVQVCGVVDYVKEMPLVFKCSKVNLNITLRGIQSAIPQRILDIMGCRGLALTNDQEDVHTYFEDGKHLLIYHSAEEALDKCRYYLKHEKEAEQIRNNAYKMIKDQFSYDRQLKRIWELSGLQGETAQIAEFPDGL